MADKQKDRSGKRQILQFHETRELENIHVPSNPRHSFGNT